MQVLTTAEQMQHLDAVAINTFGISSLVLMENAGRAFVDVLEQYAAPLDNKSVFMLCGKGNNGGDGFVIARHLSNRGARVHVVLLASRRDVKGDAKTNLEILRKMIASKKSSVTFDEILSTKKFSTLSKATSSLTPFRRREGESLIIVDAIFGTGFQGEVKGLYRDVIQWMNSQKAFVASVDIPSGVNATTGVVENVAVKADLTVTMGLAKIGHYVGEGREHAGNVAVVDISIPRFVLQHAEKQIRRHPETYRVELRDVREALPKRPLTAHKYSVGTVLVIAGSRSFIGAPFMTALSAMRAGAGAVILAIPKSLHSALTRKATEIMVLPLAETDEGTISKEAFETIEQRLGWADVVALGPGLSQNLETRRLVHKLVREIDKPLVLDADGLGMIASDVSILRRRTSATVITPHVGELRLLTKLDRDFIETHRVEVARSQAKHLGSILVLKGSPTATGTPRGVVYLNSTGNPGMATAGSGDVLTGIISSFLAQGMSPEVAAYAGVFVHGAAGDIAAKKFGERAMMAMDIADCLGEALKGIERDRSAHA
jgi:NAD(P)H-hydrate epimerase